VSHRDKSGTQGSPEILSSFSKDGSFARSVQHIDRAAIREQIAIIVLGSAVEIVEAQIEHAKRGNIHIMKYLFEKVDLFPAKPAAESPKDESAATLVFNSLKIPDEDVARFKSGEFGSSDTAKSDTVK